MIISKFNNTFVKELMQLNSFKIFMNRFQRIQRDAKIIKEMQTLIDEGYSKSAAAIKISGKYQLSFIMILKIYQNGRDKKS